LEIVMFGGRDGAKGSGGVLDDLYRLRIGRRDIDRLVGLVVE